MRNDILNNINNPHELEKLYRGNKSIFKKEFNLVYPEHKEHIGLQYWNERLNYENEIVYFGNRKEIQFVIIIAILAGLITNISNIKGINFERFFSRNAAFIIFPFLSSYFIWKQKVEFKKILLPALAILVSVVYINLLPDSNNSNSITLALIHLPLFLWSLLGYAFLGTHLKDYQKRIDFLKFNGDLVIMCVIMYISGMLFSVITFGLFELIGLKIEQFYVQHIAIWGIPAIPIVATYLIQVNPQLINKVSPIIAKIFTPLVFLNLFIYLIAVIYTGKYPYNDRNLLLVFNVLLIGVLALILFSVAEISKTSKSKFSLVLLFGLSILTIIVNSIALSAICFRIMEWGITPNRIAVLGGNILIFINLVLVSYKLLMSTKGKAGVEGVESSIATFLPIYGIWTALVCFLFPILFHFK
ncbi:MAG: hypothetical protein NTZ82_00430 [Bacteroidetes bacterium]|nr:hypothetical protein [Bacteroidota bacterium]